MFILSSYPGVGTDATTIRPLKKMGILAILVLVRLYNVV
jgi:hypothetical protein